MIFRKPYGFLIKHFRLIHLIITTILVYLVSFSRNIYIFINSCIDDPVNRYNALEYINYNVYIYIAISLTLFFIIYWLFKYKDKPRNIYTLSIVGYFLIAIYLFVLFSYFTELPNNVIEQKVIRAYRDITLIALCFQYIIIIIMFIRGLGFDIKRFNFSKDIKELDLTSEDGEEVEVDLSLDTTSLMRNVRKGKREFGYFYQEYKIFIIGIIFIIVIAVGISSYNYLNKKLKVYNENETIGYNYFITIKDSYYNIKNDKNYIIIQFNINKNGLEEKFNINNLILKIDKEEYLPNKNVCNNFNYLGICYKKQYINQKVTSYIIAYEVDTLNLDRSYLFYKESYENSFKVKLTLENYE